MTIVCAGLWFRRLFYFINIHDYLLIRAGVLAHICGGVVLSGGTWRGGGRYPILKNL